eukprot:1160781-Pelagomonas_calceolata.AAC.16
MVPVEVGAQKKSSLVCIQVGMAPGQGHCKFPLPDRTRRPLEIWALNGVKRNECAKSRVIPNMDPGRVGICVQGHCKSPLPGRKRRGYYGAFLMDDLPLVYKLVSELVKHRLPCEGELVCKHRLPCEGGLMSKHCLPCEGELVCKQCLPCEGGLMSKHRLPCEGRLTCKQLSSESL